MVVCYDSKRKQEGPENYAVCISRHRIDYLYSVLRVTPGVAVVGAATIQNEAICAEASEQLFQFSWRPESAFTRTLRVLASRFGGSPWPGQSMVMVMTTVR